MSTHGSSKRLTPARTFTPQDIRVEPQSTGLQRRTRHLERHFATDCMVGDLHAVVTCSQELLRTLPTPSSWMFSTHTPQESGRMSSALLMENQACGAMGCKAGFRFRSAPAALRAAATLPLFCRLPVHLRIRVQYGAAITSDSVSPLDIWQWTYKALHVGATQDVDGVGQGPLRGGGGPMPYPGVKAVTAMESSKKATAPMASTAAGLSWMGQMRSESSWCRQCRPSCRQTDAWTPSIRWSQGWTLGASQLTDRAEPPVRPLSRLFMKASVHAMRRRMAYAWHSACLSDAAPKLLHPLGR